MTTSNEPLTSFQARATDIVDPELLDLPAPPKRERTATTAMLLVTAVASLAMIASLRGDAAYAFADESVRDLGDLSAASAAALAASPFVAGRGMLGAGRAIRYERPLVSDTFRLMPIAGRGTDAPSIWVEVRVPAGGENVRWVPPSEFRGRLVRFDAAGPKHRGLAGAVRDVTGRDVPKDAYLLVEGESPARARWAVLLVALFAAFAMWNVFAMTRLLRKVR